MHPWHCHILYTNIDMIIMTFDAFHMLMQEFEFELGLEKAEFLDKDFRICHE